MSMAGKKLTTLDLLEYQYMPCLSLWDLYQCPRRLTLSMQTFTIELISVLVMLKLYNGIYLKKSLYVLTKKRRQNKWRGIYATAT